MIPSNTKSEILNYLESKFQYVTVNQIMLFLREKGIVLSRRSMRLLFEEMLMDDEVLIVRSNEGIKLCRTDKDFEELLNGYRSQAKTLSIEANMAVKIYNRRNATTVPQLKLDLNF